MSSRAPTNSHSSAISITKIDSTVQTVFFEWGQAQVARPFLFALPKRMVGKKVPGESGLSVALLIRVFQQFLEIALPD